MKSVFLITISLLVLSLIGCGPPEPAGEQPGSCVPSAVTVESGDGSMKVGWRLHCNSMISGYNIYISPSSLQAYADTGTIPEETHNTTVYPGDTDPDDPTVYYEAGGLENGVLYQVAVRVMFADRTLSPPSKPIPAICGPSGEFDLAARYSGEEDGFSFILGRHVRADDLSNDLYTYSRNGVHYLASPSRLDGFLRATRFSKQPENWDLRKEILSGRALGNSPTEERLPIREGDLIWMTTPENHHVQLEVIALSGDNNKSTVRLRYVYLPVEGAGIL